MASCQSWEAHGLMTPVFSTIDLVGFGLVVVALYQKRLGHLLADQARWAPVLLSSLLFILVALTSAVLFRNPPKLVVAAHPICDACLSAGVSATGYGIGRRLSPG